MKLFEKELSKIDFPFSSWLRLAVLCLAYFIGLAFCLWLAWQLRFDFDMERSYQRNMYFTIAWIVPMKLFLLACFRQFSGLLTFFGIRDLLRLLAALTIASLVLMFLRLFVDENVTFTPPRGVIFIDFVVSFAGLSAIRLALRLYRERISIGSRMVGSGREKNVAIIGAGHIGGSLARDLFTRRGLGIRPFCFLDDDKSFVGQLV